MYNLIFDFNQIHIMLKMLILISIIGLVELTVNFINIMEQRI